MKNMLINPVKIQREAVINEKYDPDFRFKSSVRLDSKQVSRSVQRNMKY